MFIGSTDDANVRFDDSNSSDQTNFTLYQSGASGKDIAINANGSGNRIILSNAQTASLATDQNNNVLFPANNAKISGSSTSTGSFGRVETKEFIGHRPMTTQIADFTASVDYVGHYNIVSGNLTCSILHPSTASVDVGAEFEFFQTSSIGNMLFETGSTGTTKLLVKNSNVNLAGQYSGATLKKVDTDTWHLVGDLT